MSRWERANRRERVADASIDARTAGALAKESRVPGPFMPQSNGPASPRSTQKIHWLPDGRDSIVCSTKRVTRTTADPEASNCVSCRTVARKWGRIA